MRYVLEKPKITDFDRFEGVFSSRRNKTINLIHLQIKFSLKLLLVFVNKGE